MAIDTRQKRESAFGILLACLRVLPTPDGSDADSADERAHLAGNYNGISAVATAVHYATEEESRNAALGGPRFTRAISERGLTAAEGSSGINRAN